MVSEKIPVRLSCMALGVSRSGFYAWKGRPESERSKQNEVLITEMKRIHEQSRGTYGLPRLHAQLRQDGKAVGKNRVSKLMKRAAISGLIRKRFRVKTTDSNHDLPIAPRVFQTEEPETHPVRPNRVWASDISYIPTDEGFLFLGTYLDLYTRKVTGFHVADHMRTEILIQALEMALGRQNALTSDLLSPSDRGSQYASEVYQEKLEACGITASMSRRGNCYDNAFAESFFATLKKRADISQSLQDKSGSTESHIRVH